MLVCFFLPWAWIFAFAYDTHTLAEACYLNALQDMESWVFMASTGLFLFVLISEDMQSLLKTNTDLTTAYEQTVQGWVNVLDLRHQETKNHTLRVTEMTVELAKLAGFTDQDELDRIKRGAILHDIGKVGIPDAILTKPGMLNNEEFEYMKLHPEIA
ncbi:MAG: HD domain-containing protein, partial [Candidatus Competibacteraceae bacterium]|nr:HD domain-containing protein [Candidatus Competibacteraceae bacterium]